MRQNILLAGVGGQGILSLSYVICNAALEEGLNFKQSEVHGMSQRGGAVQSNLRISSDPINSDLIPRGQCDLILSVEPLESLRYIDYLSPDGWVVTSILPHKNIPDYPAMDETWNKLDRVRKVVPVSAGALAKQAGSPLAQNMVMLGAASGYLNLKIQSLERWVENLWTPKGEKVVSINMKAFRIGRVVAEFLSSAIELGINIRGLAALAELVPFEAADRSNVREMVEIINKYPEDKWRESIGDLVKSIEVG
jgi:indolepyruvate ferredoxin oxidoreductase beta subunit